MLHLKNIEVDTKVNDNLVGDSSNNYSIEAHHKASVVLTKMSKSSYLP